MPTKGFKDFIPESLQELCGISEDRREDKRSEQRTFEAVEANREAADHHIDNGPGDKELEPRAEEDETGENLGSGGDPFESLMGGDTGETLGGGAPATETPESSRGREGDTPEDKDDVPDVFSGPGDTESGAREPLEGGVPSTEAPDSPRGEERDETVQRGFNAEIESMSTEDLQDFSAHIHGEIADREGKTGLDETKKKDVVREEEVLWSEGGEYRRMRDNAEALHSTELPSVSTVQRSDYTESDAAVTTLESQIISGIEEGRVADAIVSEYSEWETEGIGDEYTHPKLVGLVQDTEHYDDIVGNEVTDLLDVIEHRGRVHDSTTIVKGKVQNKIQTLREKENRAESQEEYRNAESLKDELSSERNRLSDDIDTVIEETGSDIDQEYISEIHLGERLEEVNETVGILTDNNLNLFEELTDNFSKKSNPITVGSEHEDNDNPYQNSAGYIQNFDMLYDKLEEAKETLGGPFAEETEGLLDEMVEATSYFEDIVSTARNFGTEFYTSLHGASDLPQYEAEFENVLESGYVTTEDGGFTYGERIEELAEYTAEFEELRNTNPGEATERAEDLVSELG